MVTDRPDGLTLDNWDHPPFNRWSFLQIDRMVETTPVKRGWRRARPFPRAEQDLSAVTFIDLNGTPRRLDAFLAASFTNGFLVLHRGQLICENYFNGMTPETLHLSQSVAKSVVGTLAGILVGEGRLDPAMPLVELVPELADCGYATATLDHVLDMRSGVRFTEDYGDPAADITKLDHAAGWRPRHDPNAPATIRELILTLPQEREHGGIFAYRSIETDVLAWALERASGKPLAELVSRKLWKPLGAEQDASFTVDSAGTALADGGFNATLRDYARLGQAMIQGGQINGRQIVPADWVEATRTGDNSLFGEPYRSQTPNGAYRRQWWIMDVDRGINLALGVFGQMIYLDPGAELLVVKLSTWPTYLDATLKIDTLRAAEAIGVALNG